MTFTWIFIALVVLGFLHLVRSTRRAGPKDLDAAELRSATLLHRVTADSPGEGWTHLGAGTSAEGLRLLFHAEDDPAASATLEAPREHRSSRRSSYWNGRSVELGEDYEIFHVHTAGHIFRVRLRGEAGIAGRHVQLLMVVGSDGRPVGGRIENEKHDHPAIGGWIDVDSAELLAIARPG